MGEFVLHYLLLMLRETLLLCLGFTAISCAPFVGAYFIWYVVHRVNRRDDKRAEKPFGDVPPEVIQNLTPDQLAILKSHLERHPR